MKIVLDISPESRRVLESHDRLAGQVDQVLHKGLVAAGAAGADHTAELMITGQLKLKSRRGGLGTAGQISSWPVAMLWVAVGIPENAEAHTWAGIQEHGGTITASPGRALAVPVRTEARQYTSPRDAAADGVDLVMIKRRGKAPLLAEVFGDRVETWYVLLKSVTLPATHFLSDGVTMSVPVMVAAMQQSIDADVADVMEGR